MQCKGMLPNETTVTCVLNAFSHSGHLQEALDIFHNLENRFNIKSSIFHYNCIVDVLGRAGRLQDAENFIADYMKKQQIEPMLLDDFTGCL
jgi:pentatricopeptide repeat protein